MCFVFPKMWCELGARQRGVNQWQYGGKFHRGCSGHCHEDRQFVGRALFPALSLGRAAASRVFKKAAGAERTSLEFWRTNAASTQVSFKNATSCTSWCLLAAIPCRSSHKSASLS